MIDLLVTGGTVVTPGRTALLDVAVSGERIAAVAEPGVLPAGGARILDATGNLVLPGGVEPHAHIFEPMYRGWSGGEEVWLQGVEGATRAAIFGGTTTVLSFAFMAVHVTEEQFHAGRAVEHRREVFAGSSHTDFGFHPVLTGSPSERTIATVGEAVQDGTATMKLFTTDLTTGQAGVRIDNGSALAVMRECAAHGAMVMVHAEDDDLIKHMEARLAETGEDRVLANVSLVHTTLGEELAVRSVARMAEEAGAGLYVVHVGGREPLDAIAELRARGLPVYGETLHNLLCFSTDHYARPDGAKYHIGMGLKPPGHQEPLWEGLADGRLSTLATDEYTTSFAVKMAGATIQTTPGGHVGVETRGTIGYSEGVAAGRMPLERFVEVFSTSPARLMGLYPRKGVIAPGSDADLVLWDPDAERTIALDDLHHDSDYSPWEGWDVRGWPVTTVLRGKVVVEDGRLLGTPADGRWLPRRIDPELLAGPAL
ncbi:MAG TPA: amidohydrolase family protein [Gaiellaceae bacterium]|nr:amidohydrolase family protein [Gaiellaceae bacterium]